MVKNRLSVGKEMTGWMSEKPDFAAKLPKMIGDVRKVAFSVLAPAERPVCRFDRMKTYEKLRRSGMLWAKANNMPLTELRPFSGNRFYKQNASKELKP